MMTLVEVHPRWRDQLDAGLEEMALPLGDAQRDLLIGYLGLLNKWNRAYNLTAVRDPEAAVRRQLLDSLSIAPWVDRGPVLDVGTGAGLPGIPLAIIRPELNFSLLDSNGKKTRFVQQAVGELGLANVEVIRARAEQLERPGHYRLITSRAFASLADMVSRTRGLLDDDGQWLAMKGTDPDAEYGDLPPDVEVSSMALQVPGEPGQRHLAILRLRA